LNMSVVLWTTTFKKGRLRNVSQDDNIPFTTPVNYYSTLLLHHFLPRLLNKVFQLCVCKLKTNY